MAIANLQMLNAVLYIIENDCKWRGLPASFGRWHTVYTRLTALANDESNTSENQSDHRVG